MKKKTDKKGYIHIYTGDGKGKTTAALGIGIRAAGHGNKTYMGQFMKGQHYGELTALRDHPYITIEQYRVLNVFVVRCKVAYFDGHNFNGDDIQIRIITCKVNNWRGMK